MTTTATPSVKLEKIDAKKAKQFLLKNKFNRPVNELNRLSIAAQMKAGKFITSGQSIKFDWDGNLIDGQHTLLSIVDTNTEHDIFVARNLDPAAFKVIDTGKNRSAADVLGINKIPNPGSIAAIAKFIISFQRGRYYAAAGRDSNKQLRITNGDISDFVEKNIKRIADSRTVGFNKKNKVVAGNTLSAMHFIFSKIHADDADKFCHQLAEGTDIGANSPILALRQVLIADIRAMRKMTHLERVALICLAWNYFRTKKKIDHDLAWNMRTDEFPKPI